MTKLGAMLLAVTAATASTAAIGDETVVGPAYLGPRSTNPEQETFAVITGVSAARAIAFFGPARSVGTVAGDPEKDTIAFWATVVFDQTQAAFGSEGARELQGYKSLIAVLTQPAFGAKGARDLQGFAKWMAQPADGARAARELQGQPDAALAQFANQDR